MSPYLIFCMHANTRLTSVKRLQRQRLMRQADSLLSRALCFPNMENVFTINVQCSFRYPGTDSRYCTYQSLKGKLHNHLRVACFSYKHHFFTVRFCFSEMDWMKMKSVFTAILFKSFLLQENHQRPDFFGILSLTSCSMVLYNNRKVIIPEWLII